MDARGGVALVTGGASGIGRATSRRWARAGFTVVAVDVDAAGLAETALGHTGIETRVLDVRDAVDVGAAVEEIEAGHGPLERVVNCAAIQPTALLADMPAETIHRVMDTNYGGYVNVALAALPRMLARGRGVLVHVCSIASYVPSMHFGAYSATNFARLAFTEVLYHENRGRGVQFVCVCPPQVDTPLRAQATSKPRIQESGPAPIPPETVVDAIDQGIAKRRFLVYPGWHTRVGVLLRRFAPALLWKINHDAEGI